jgi:hypothetical protein
MSTLKRLDFLVNFIAKLSTPTSLYKNLLKLAKLIVLLSAVYGFAKGLEESIKIIKARKPLRLSNKTLEPIANLIAQASLLTVRPVLIGIATSLVVITAPISVPYIMIMCQEDGNKRDDDHEKYAKRIGDTDEMRTMK